MVLGDSRTLSTAMRTAEDILAVALGALAGQIVSRAEKKFRTVLAVVFNEGAGVELFAALGLAAAGDVVSQWPGESSDLSSVQTVLDDERRNVLHNLWHFNAGLGDTVVKMSTDVNLKKNVTARLTSPDTQPPTYQPFGPLMSRLITTLWSGVTDGLFDIPVQPPPGFHDMTQADKAGAVKARLAQQYEHLKRARAPTTP